MTINSETYGVIGILFWILGMYLSADNGIIKSGVAMTCIAVGFLLMQEAGREEKKAALK